MTVDPHRGGTVLTPACAPARNPPFTNSFSTVISYGAQSQTGRVINDPTTILPRARIFLRAAITVNTLASPRRFLEVVKLLAWQAAGLRVRGVCMKKKDKKKISIIESMDRARRARKGGPTGPLTPIAPRLMTLAEIRLLYLEAHPRG